MAHGVLRRPRPHGTRHRCILSRPPIISGVQGKSRRVWEKRQALLHPMRLKPKCPPLPYRKKSCTRQWVLCRRLCMRVVRELPLTPDLPYDFSPALDGLPRASQAAAMLAAAPLVGHTPVSVPLPVPVDASDLLTAYPTLAATRPRRAAPAPHPVPRSRARAASSMRRAPAQDALARQVDTLARSGVVDDFFVL